MCRIATLFVLASTLGLLACSDSPMDLAGPEFEPPPEDPPRAPATVELAFVSTRDGAEHIYVANADGSGVTRVTEGSSPAWSWDGRRIAFVRKASSAGPGGIYVMNFDGSALTYVGAGSLPTWSPDGRIAFRGVSGSYTSNGWPLPRYSLYISNTDGSGRTQLDDRTPGIGAAAWSPDGRSIAFRADGTAWILDADGSDLRELEGLRDTWSAPAWSPDGSRIAATTHPGPWEFCDWFGGCQPGPGMGESSVILSYHLAMADREVVDAIYPIQSALASNPDWSPDGSRMAFDLRDLSFVCLGGGCPREKSDPRRIFTLSVETGEVRRLIPEAANPAVADYEDWGAVWSRTTR